MDFMNREKDPSEAFLEESPSAASETQSPSEVLDWDSQILNLEKEIKELREKLLLSMADLDNFRKQSLREKEESRQYAIVGFVRDFLPVADNLDRAIACFPKEPEDPMIKTVVEGISFVQQELNQLLTRHHIEKVGAVGEKFDPHFHQAMFEVEVEEEESGRIKQVLQEGYKLHERLLRPAMVGVSKLKASSATVKPQDN
jgi:molecular chaperone GrpE